MVYAVSADLVGSRNIDSRRELSLQIEAALKRIRREFDSDWLAPLVAARGMDELSGVLRRPDHVFDILVMLNEEIWPKRFRWGVGAGDLDIGTEQPSAARMDGTAFHLAADALKIATEHSYPIIMLGGAFRGPAVALAVQLSRAHELIEEGWTDARAEAVRLYRTHAKQKDVAAALGVTPQTVSDALAGARIRQLMDAEEAIRRWLMGIDRTGEEVP